MAKFVSFASGWSKDNGKIGCAAGGDNCSIFDPAAGSSEKLKLKVYLETESGEKLEVTNFYIKELAGGVSRNGKQLPTHQCIVAIEE